MLRSATCARGRRLAAGGRSSSRTRSACSTGYLTMDGETRNQPPAPDDESRTGAFTKAARDFFRDVDSRLEPLTARILSVMGNG